MYDAISQRIRADIPLLDEVRGGGSVVLFDNAATTPLPRHVMDVWTGYESTARANTARSSHWLAERTTDAYESARSDIAEYLHAQSPSDIIFTSGTTAGINLVARAIEGYRNDKDHIVVTAAEHHSNFLPWRALCERQQLEFEIAPVLSDGSVNVDAVSRMINDRTRLVAITHVSNVTGAETDLKRVVAEARRYETLVLVDGAQRIAHGRVDVELIDADFYTFSGHKCFAPTGVGVLWARQSLMDILATPILGGGMTERAGITELCLKPAPWKYEVGTPPIGQAIALASALRWLADLDPRFVEYTHRTLSSLMLKELDTIPGLKLIGPNRTGGRVPIFSFSVEDAHPHDIAHYLSESGIAVRAGFHCAEPLHETLGMGPTTRASLSVFNTSDEIVRFGEKLRSCVAQLR